MSMIGKTVAHYQITCEIGKGGMGEVYQAKDQKLGRDVAIKVLPEEFAKNVDRVARFQREAKLLASLNHPNIAAIYGIEESGGTNFLVMELVEGETLDERVKSAPISVEEALKLALQIAEALEAAHEKGVIHRDLKPANIRVTPEGKVKVLDFGLAKALTGEQADLNLSNSPTLSVAATQQGVILGTAAYMSPEQAKGRAVDKRADIWAFGCILYECLTGKKAFAGETVTDTLAAILRAEPDWQALLETTPPGIQLLLRRCLNKEVRNRFQAIGDVRIEIDSLSSGAFAEMPIPPKTKSGWTRQLVWMTTGALLGGVIIGASLSHLWIGVRRQSPDVDSRQQPVVKQLTANPPDLPVYGASISPDGRHVAYTDAGGLYLRIIETGETRPLAGAEKMRFWDVSWYPDNTRLLVNGPSANGEIMSLYSIPFVGGELRLLQDDVWRAAVSPDGAAIAFIRGRFPVREVWVMGSGGERPRRIVQGKVSDTFWQVGWSPDSSRILFGRASGVAGIGAKTSIESVDLDGGQATVIVTDPLLFQDWRSVLPFAWLPDNRLIYTLVEKPPNEDSSNLWEVKVNPRTGIAEGAPKRLTEITSYNIRDIRATADGKRITFLRERSQGDIYVAPLQSFPAYLGTPSRITLDDRIDEFVEWVPDGKTLVFSSTRAGSGKDLFKQKIGETSATHLVIGPENDDRPCVTPDGAWVLYQKGRFGESEYRQLMRVPISGGPSELVLEGKSSIAVDCPTIPSKPCVMSELVGSELVFSEVDVTRGRGRVLKRLAAATEDFGIWRLSPEGDRVALVDFSDRVQIFSLRGNDKLAFSAPGWTAFEFVAWAADGQGVYAIGYSLKGPRLTNTAILHLDMKGNVRVLRHQPNEWNVWPSASPDGRSLAFSTMKLESNAWMIEKF